MRCTKCHYLSFEPEPRCKNCGHDLSLEEGDRLEESGVKRVSFKSGESFMSGESFEAIDSTRADRTATAVLTRPKAVSSRIPTKDLPLFVQSIPGVSDQLADEDDPEPEPDLEPLVKVPARPRTPVSVRRATPDPARLRAKYGLSPTPEPDLWSNMPADPIDQVDLHQEETAFQDLPLTATAAMSWPSEPTPERLPAGWQEPVGAGARLFAAMIDAMLLGGIAAAVIYFTLRVTGLSLAQITLLPALPLAGLLLMMVVGYLLMFTVASGQTVGKMAMHLRVVGTSPEAIINDRITVPQATVRALAALPSVLILGLGFVPALVGAGLALHDRIAHTRVIRL